MLPVFVQFLLVQIVVDEILLALFLRQVLTIDSALTVFCKHAVNKPRAASVGNHYQSEENDKNNSFAHTDSHCVIAYGAVSEKNGAWRKGSFGSFIYRCPSVAE